jgi:hypothetical protein
VASLDAASVVCVLELLQRPDERLPKVDFLVSRQLTMRPDEVALSRGGLGTVRRLAAGQELQVEAVRSDLEALLRVSRWQAPGLGRELRCRAMSLVSVELELGLASLP